MTAIFTFFSLSLIFACSICLYLSRSCVNGVCLNRRTNGSERKGMQGVVRMRVMKDEIENRPAA